MKSLFLIPASISLLVLSACHSGPKQERNLLQTLAYLADTSGHLMVFDYKSSCRGDTLTRDTLNYYFGYRLSGDTLVEEVPMDLPDGGRIMKTTTLKRTGTGTRMDSVWEVQSVRYPVLSGSYGPGTALDSADQAGDARDSEATVYEGEVEQVFSVNHAEGIRDGDSIFHSGEGPVFSVGVLRFYGNAQPARKGLADWTNNPSLNTRSIAVSAVDAYTMRFKGLRTGEVVTEVYSPDYTLEDFSSSVAAHAPYRHYLYAQNCPDDGLPAWFDGFLQENAGADGSQGSADPQSSGKP